MARSAYSCRVRCARVVAAALLCSLSAGGCGSNLGGSFVSKTLFVSECGAAAPATDLIILDWSGGTSNMFPGDDFPGLDFAAFAASDGGTLADDVEAFKEAVRGEVVRIFCDEPSVSVAVQNEDGRARADVTRVYLVQDPSQAGGGQIGQGEYDPCNRQHDNSALVFGEGLLKLPGSYSFDEWVRIFANVTAHEIGHTLGFNHVPRSGVLASEHPLYVELMLAGHTVDEMLRPQRFLADETNCPDDATRSHRRMDPRVFTCGLSN